jgi:hypothetical protein
LDEIVANSGETALIAPSRDLVEALRRAGLHLKLRVPAPMDVFYLDQAPAAR